MQWGSLCTSETRRAMLAGAIAPGRATHARQVKGEKSDKYSEQRWKQDVGQFCKA